MNAWTSFATLFAAIDTPVEGSVNGIVAALSPYVATTLIAGITVVLLLKMIKVSFGYGGGTSLVQFESELIVGAAIYLIVSQVSVYNQFVTNLFLNGIGTELTNVISGTSGGAPVNAASFDKVWNEAYVAGLTVYRKLSWDDFGLQMLVVLYWIIALVAIVVGFAIWLMSKIAVALLVATGAIFVAFYAIPPLRSMFQRWLGMLISNIILQALVITCLVILTQAESMIIGSIAANGSDNAIEQLQLLLGGIALFIVSALVLWQLPGMAQGLAGGLTFHATSLARTMQGGITATTGAMSGLGSAGSSSIGGARAALSAAPGRSMSS